MTVVSKHLFEKKCTHASKYQASSKRYGSTLLVEIILLIIHY